MVALTQILAQKVALPASSQRTPVRSAPVRRTAPLRAARLSISASAAVATAPKADVQKGATIEILKDFTAFDLDQFLAGKSKVWTFWNSEPAEFPWTYAKEEHAYILEGEFTVTYEGGEPVRIVAGDFCKFPVGETKFEVHTPVRKFFTLKE